MRRFYVLIFLLSLCLGAFSQEITVRFTGQLNGTSYCRLDSVKVTNLTRDWTETVEYPDTIIVLGGTVGTDLNIVATQGLGQNIPNPFDCETRVELSVSQRENVRMQLLDASGKQYADYSGSLDAGVHTFDISAAAPQTYILNAVVGDKSYSIRMVNMGSGCGSSIKYAGISGSITAKLTTAKEFHSGDNMRYVGYTTIGGQPVASEVKEQAQVVSQYVTLSFTHYSIPAVETLAATDITTTSVTLHGNITYDGGSAITARGFYWGTAVDNLSQMVSAESGDGEYSAELTGLTLGDTYYYCAFAINSTGASTGEILSFTISVLPTIQTNDATNITTTGVTFSGNVTSDGGATVTSRGFIYGTNPSNLTWTLQSGSGTGSFTKVVTGIPSGTTYYYKAYATNSAGTAYGEILSFATMSTISTLNGHECVDLGLPSGMLWATCNVGANSPTAYGNYYAWGETTAKTTYSWSTYRYCNGSNSTLTKYCNNSSYGNNGYTDARTTLEASDDAATVNWGSGWRMPTQTEMQELIDNCTRVWTTQNGVRGRLFTGPNGNSIFLPAAGYRSGGVLSDVSSYGDYWSSSLGNIYPDGTWYLYFYSNDYGMDDGFRYQGLSVRAVCPHAEPTVATGTAANISFNGAKLYGAVTHNGGATLTARGFIYGTNSSNLTQTVQSGSGTGNFTALLTDLIPSTTYYYKAYATYSVGTVYGEVMSFTTNCECGIGMVTDIDGNQYATVLIGEQCWMAENLRTTKFADGTSIPLGSSTSSTTVYRYNPNNNSSNVSTYGYLYNWTAAMHGASSSEANPSGVQGICPNGWHLPSKAEWTQLEDYLSSQSQYWCGGGSLRIAKSLASTTGWDSSTGNCAIGNNPSDNNSTGFGALPAGKFYSGSGGNYHDFGRFANFWTATEVSSTRLYQIGLASDSNIIQHTNYAHEFGCSVRCVKDE